jgi:hypothetical protein
MHAYISSESIVIQKRKVHTWLWKNKIKYIAFNCQLLTTDFP